MRTAPSLEGLPSGIDLITICKLETWYVYAIKKCFLLNDLSHVSLPFILAKRALSKWSRWKRPGAHTKDLWQKLHLYCLLTLVDWIALFVLVSFKPVGFGQRYVWFRLVCGYAYSSSSFIAYSYLVCLFNFITWCFLLKLMNITVCISDYVVEASVRTIILFCVKSVKMLMIYINGRCFAAQTLISAIFCLCIPKIMRFHCEQARTTTNKCFSACVVSVHVFSV